MIAVAAAHIGLDEAGVAWIDGTTTKVIEVVLAKTTSGLTPEELQAELPHLSLAQVYAALAFYHAHQEELDVQIEERRDWTNKLRSQEPNPLRRADLRARLAKGE